MSRIPAYSADSMVGLVVENRRDSGLFSIASEMNRCASNRRSAWYSHFQRFCMFERITFDPNIMGGRACIRGMRIPVSVIVGQIAHGASFEEILEGYPDLQREDIQQAIEYAAWLAQEQVQTS